VDDVGFVSRVEVLSDRVTRRDEYPFSIPALTHLERLDLHPRVTYLVGDNGTGKSTILEAIALLAGFSCGRIGAPRPDTSFAQSPSST
jgi:predicted ATPase